MSDAPEDTTPEPEYNYFQVITDPYCDILGIPRGTAVQSFINAMFDNGELKDESPD